MLSILQYAYFSNFFHEIQPLIYSKANRVVPQKGWTLLKQEELHLQAIWSSSRKLKFLLAYKHLKSVITGVN